MKKSLLFVVVVAVVALILYVLPTPAPQPAPYSNSFVLGPVHIFDGEQVINARYLEVKNGYITQLHNQRPNSELPWINGEDKWLIPGLIDAHVHAWGDALEQQLQRGVTTVVDMFGSPEFLQLRQAKRSHTLYTKEADLYGAGLLMTAPNGHGTQFGINVPAMSSPEQASELVAQRVSGGSDFIKIVYTAATASYQHAPSITKAELTAAIAATHAQHKLAVVHVHDYDSAVDAVAAGADGLVHSFFDQRISDQLLQAMVDNQVFVIPTMVVYEGMLRGTSNKQILLNNKDLHVSSAARATINQSFNMNMPEEFWHNLLWTTAAMYEAGIPILAGSDAPNPNTAHGWSLIVEMILMEEAGMPLPSILSSATQNAATAFQLEKRARIAIGYKADLLLLNQSPLESLTTLLTPAAIWKNGFAMHQ